MGRGGRAAGAAPSGLTGAGGTSNSAASQLSPLGVAQVCPLQAAPEVPWGLSSSLAASRTAGGATAQRHVLHRQGCSLAPGYAPPTPVPPHIPLLSLPIGYLPQGPAFQPRALT